MRALGHFLLATCLFTALLAGPVARACGDKLLVLGRGVRFQAYTAVHPASILMFVRMPAKVGSPIADPQLQPALIKAGHKLRVAEDRERLEQELRSGVFDLVLSELEDAAAVEGQVQAAHSGALVVPVVYSGTKAEVEAAKKQYRCALKSPSGSSHYLAAIDAAMEVKAKRDRSKPASLR